MKKDKKTHPGEGMDVVNHGRFSIMSSDKIDAIIVDPEIAQNVKHRRWCLSSGGYPVANVKGEIVFLFDYVMALKFDEKPEGCYVDHINHDKLDNRLTNLRFVSPTESSHNMPMRSDNTSGVTGVNKTKNNTYRAYITANKVRYELGHYKTIEEAIAARREAEERFNFKTRPHTIKEKLSNTTCIDSTKDDGYVFYDAERRPR